MKNSMYASADKRKLGIFEGDSNHAILFEYVPELDVIEISIRTGDTIEGSFNIKVHDNQAGRKYEGILGLRNYLNRLLESLVLQDNKGLS